LSAGVVRPCAPAGGRRGGRGNNAAEHLDLGEHLVVRLHGKGGKWRTCAPSARPYMGGISNVAADFSDILWTVSPLPREDFRRWARPVSKLSRPPNIGRGQTRQVCAMALALMSSKAGSRRSGEKSLSIVLEHWRG